MVKKRYAGVLVKSNDKVLLCKRNNKGTLPGEWSIPCGGVKKGEKPIEGAAREYYEETNNKVSNPLELRGIINRYGRDGINKKGELSVYLMDVDEDIMPDLENAKDGNEHTDCGYYSLDELPTPLGTELEGIIRRMLK